MNLTNQTSAFVNETLMSAENFNPCPRQRHITRPLLFVHNYALFFFGSILNFLAFVILMQRALRCHSTFAYLAFLSFSNGLLSLVHSSRWMLRYYFNLVLENYLLTCRLHRFFLDFLTHFSLFTLVCVNIDRARTVTRNHPTRRYSRSKFQMVSLKELLVGSLLGAFHFHWIIKYGYEIPDGGKTIARCNLHENEKGTVYYTLLTTIYPPFELAVFFCLPLLINIFCTILIVRSLSIRMRTAERFHSVKEQRTQTTPHRILAYFLPKTDASSNVHSCLCFKMQCRRHTRLRLKLSRSLRSLNRYEEESEAADPHPSSTLVTRPLQDGQSQHILRTTTHALNKKHRNRRTRDLHLSAMLIGLNVLYLVLNLPFNLHQTFAKYLYSENSDRCPMMFTSLLLDSSQQAFFSTNFFLYVLTNRRFREEFYNTMMRILAHCRRHSSRATVKLPQQPQQRISSCNQSTTAMPTNQTSDNPMNPILAGHYRDSIISEKEPTETSVFQQQTTVSFNENHKFSTKLSLARDSSDD